MSITDELFEVLNQWRGLGVDHIKVDHETLSQLKNEAKHASSYEIGRTKFFFCGFEIIMDPEVKGYEVIGK